MRSRVSAFQVGKGEMPNNIANRLHVQGSAEQVAAVFDLVEEDDGKGRMDFNKIIPMPRQLRGFSPHMGILDALGDGWQPGRNYRLGLNEVEIEAYSQGLQNLNETGYIYWGDWAEDNWGTKWNAYSTPDCRDTKDTIYFNTAWSEVTSMIKVLSVMFPAARLHYSFADEQTGCHTGRYVIYQGEVVEDTSPADLSKEAYELAFELTGAGEWYRWNADTGTYELVTNALFRERF